MTSPGLCRPPSRRPPRWRPLVRVLRIRISLEPIEEDLAAEESRLAEESVDPGGDSRGRSGRPAEDLPAIRFLSAAPSEKSGPMPLTPVVLRPSPRRPVRSPMCPPPGDVPVLGELDAGGLPIRCDRGAGDGLARPRAASSFPPLPPRCPDAAGRSLRHNDGRDRRTGGDGDHDALRPVPAADTGHPAPTRA